MHMGLPLNALTLKFWTFLLVFFCQAFQSKDLSILTILSTIYFNQLGLDLSNSQEPENCFSPYGKNSSGVISCSKQGTICQLNGKKHQEWHYEITLKLELEFADHFGLNSLEDNPIFWAIKKLFSFL